MTLIPLDCPADLPPGAYRQYTTLAEAEQTGASTCWTYQTSTQTIYNVEAIDGR